MACQTTTDGIQVLGGVGYMKDFGQEKRFRDARHIQLLLGSAPMKKIRYMETTYKKN
jgi:alkylation response protein AidB-like acyl-CoA dehydrogenase